MTVQRVVGLETEFGISVAGDPMANPMWLSGQVVTTYAAAHGIRAAQSRWDYADESPLVDARGWVMGRSLADPSQLTDEVDPTLANVVLTNGARLYVDHAHPEYSSPETTNPRDAVRWDRAGELVALDAVRRLEQVPGGPRINLYKNNTDGKGASYGSHENYLMSRATPFGEIIGRLTPFFVTRAVICGAGRVGIGQKSDRAGYQISSRADFFEAEVGLETTIKRPIINTRDEPHADPDRYRRLHVIIGDANQCDVANLLKVGTTSLVLGMIEDGVLDRRFEIRNPVGALREVSHDPTLQTKVELADGRALTALEVQWHFLESAARWLQARGDDPIPEATGEVMRLWESVLTRLGSDPLTCSADIDWVAKLHLLERYRSRDGMAWDDARLAAIDVQFTDVRPEKGLLHRLRDRGLITELVTREQATSAVTDPPRDTRAYFRGESVRRFGDAVAAASWDSVIFDLGPGTPLQRVPLSEPLRGDAASVEGILTAARTPAELLAALKN